jgi:molybdopterin converting factor subunit 1
MKMRVLLFARYAELAGVQELEVEVDPDRTVGDLWELLRSRYPALQSVSERPLMACDRTYAEPGKVLGGSAEVAFFPPVSGG